jgi:hypothetical protein
MFTTPSIRVRGGRSSCSLALEEEKEEVRENLNLVLKQQPLDGIPSTLTTFHDLLNEMEAQELLEHEPNAPSDAEQLDDVNNIAAMAPVTILEDPIVIPKAMSELLSLLSTVDNASFRTTFQFH